MFSLRIFAKKIDIFVLLVRKMSVFVVFIDFKDFECVLMHYVEMFVVELVEGF